MPIYDFECGKCYNKFDAIVKLNAKSTVCKCGYIAKKVFPKSAPRFNLSYNPKSDICDWDGNTTRFYDEYKKMKADGKNPRIPALDGDG